MEAKWVYITKDMLMATKSDLVETVGQATITMAAALGAIAGPLIIGALTEVSPANGWRTFYVCSYLRRQKNLFVLINIQWVQMGLWGAAAVGIFAGYRPPKRHTRLDHLSFWHKLSYLDFVGIFLLTAGLTLFLVGLNLGGSLYAWTNVRVLVTLVPGIAIIILFGVYEWKGTKVGILHHDLFRGGAGAGRTFALCIALIFVEGILLFAFVIFYPVL
jgi:MFS family permease